MTEIGDKESVVERVVHSQPAGTSNKTAINKDEVRRSVRRIPSIKLGTSKQPAKRRKEDKRTERWTERGGTVPGIPRGVEAGNQPLSPRIRTLETKNHPRLPTHHRSYPSSSSSSPSFLQPSLRFLVPSALLRNHLGRGLSPKVLDNLSPVHRTTPPPSNGSPVFFFLLLLLSFFRGKRFCEESSRSRSSRKKRRQDKSF